MPRPNVPRTLVARVKALEREVARLGRRSQAHTETKTFLIGGTIADTVFVPWVFTATNLYDKGAETKYLVSLVGQMRTGGASVNWEFDGVEIYAGHVLLDTGMTSVDLDTPVEITPGWHSLRPVFQAGSSGEDAACGYALETLRR